MIEVWFRESGEFDGPDSYGVSCDQCNSSEYFDVVRSHVAAHKQALACARAHQARHDDLICDMTDLAPPGARGRKEAR